MSTATYATHNLSDAAPAGAQPQRKPLWRRVFDAMALSQQRRAEREIARYLATHGGLLTDGMEREMMLRLTGANRKSL